MSWEVEVAGVVFFQLNLSVQSDFCGVGLSEKAKDWGILYFTVCGNVKSSFWSS